MLVHANGLTRELKFVPGYDYRNEVPSKNYGIHPMHVQFILKTESVNSVVDWALVFEVNLGLLPTSVKHVWLTERSCAIKEMYAWDYSIHQRLPMEIGESKIRSHCAFLNCSCYEGYGLQTSKYELFALFANEGEEAVWKRMETDAQKHQEKWEKIKETENKLNLEYGYDLGETLMNGDQ